MGAYVGCMEAFGKLPNPSQIASSTASKQAPSSLQGHLYASVQEGLWERTRYHSA
jgi:hypothetical protein